MSLVKLQLVGMRENRNGYTGHRRELGMGFRIEYANFRNGNGNDLVGVGGIVNTESETHCGTSPVASLGPHKTRGSRPWDLGA